MVYWFIIVTCAYIYIIIYNYIYKHTKSTRPYGPISHQKNKYIMCVFNMHMLTKNQQHHISALQDKQYIINFINVFRQLNCIY